MDKNLIILLQFKNPQGNYLIFEVQHVETGGEELPLNIFLNGTHIRAVNTLGEAMDYIKENYISILYF